MAVKSPTEAMHIEIDVSCAYVPCFSRACLSYLRKWGAGGSLILLSFIYAACVRLWYPDFRIRTAEDGTRERSHSCGIGYPVVEWSLDFLSLYLHYDVRGAHGNDFG